MEKDIRDMKSGERQLFYRTHYLEILEYCEEYGFKETITKYGMTENTLKKMLDRGEYTGGRRSPNRNMSKTEKLLLRSEINEEATQNLRKEVKDLKDTFMRFQDEVSNQVASKFFKPLIEHLELSDGMTRNPNSSFPESGPAGFLESVTDPAPGSHGYDILSEAGEVVADYEDDSEIQKWLLNAIQKARGEENWKRAYELLSHYFLQPYSFTDPEFENNLAIWKSQAMDLIEHE